MDSNIRPYASKATMPWMHGHGFKHESHRNPSSNPFKAHSLADAFIFTFPCPRFSNSIVHPSGEQRTLIRSTLRFSMQLKKLPPPPLHSKESALLLLFECLSKCHPLSPIGAADIVFGLFSPLLPRYSTSAMLKLCGRVAWTAVGISQS